MVIKNQLEEYIKLLEQNLVTLEAALKAKEEETVFIWWWF